MRILRLPRWLRLLGLFTRLSIQNDAAYRIEFFGMILATAIQVGAELLGLWVIFSNTRSLGGWNSHEVLALLGVYRIVLGAITMIIAPNMRSFMGDVRTGNLDFILLKPMNSQFHVSVQRVVVWELADVFLGMVMAGVAASKLSLTPGPGRVLMFLFMLSCAVAVIYSFWLMLATLAFWFTKLSNIEMVFWNLFEAGRYPVHIYRPWLRWALTYLIPLAILTTMPAQAWIGRAEPGNLPIGLGAAVLSLVVSSAFWRWGVRHYTGASA